MKQPELGKKILDLRKKKGFTQEELVEKCNVNVRTIQRIESGEVSPRNSTLRIILEALEYDFNRLNNSDHTDFIPSNFIKRLFLIDVDGAKHLAYSRTQLQIAWISALINFLIGFVLYGFEYLKNDAWFHPNNYSIYTLSMVISFVSFFFTMRGLIIIGDIHKNSLLKIVAYILIVHELFNNAYSVSAVFNPLIKSTQTDIGIAITIGAILIIYGVALIKLHRHIGIASSLAGVFAIIGGFFLMTVILWWVGLIALVPVDILLIVVLYKEYEFLKSE